MSFPSRLRPWLAAAIVWLVAFDVAFLWQRHAGAHASEFGGHPDEAAHVVTGLMVRDYIAAGASGSPMAFADEYYKHYPKIGLGVWPPLFYVVQSAWTLPFGESRTSLLLMMAALAATLATLVWRALHEPLGEPAAAVAALVCLSMPLAREFYAMVMAETLCAVTMLGATLAWGRFLDEGRLRDVLWCGAWAAAALLTKASAVALVPMAVISFVLARQWPLARAVRFGGWWRGAPWWLWLGSLGALAGALGWTWKFKDLGREKGGWEHSAPTWEFTRLALPEYARSLAIGAGIFLCALALLGLVAMLARPGARPGRWAAAAGLIAGVYLFQSAIPVGREHRHMLPALPAIAMLAAAGAAWIARRQVRPALAADAAPPRRTLLLVLAAALAVQLAWSEVLRPLPPWRARKQWNGFSPIAAQIATDAERPRAEILISSDATGEGMFVSELALCEKRPGRFVRRASKELATMKWSGRDAKPVFGSPEAMRRHLLGSNLDYLVIDDSVPYEKRGPQHDWLRQIAEDPRGGFWLRATSAITRGGEPQPVSVKLYRIIGREPILPPREP